MNPESIRTEQPNVGLLADYMIRIQQLSLRFGSYHWRGLGDPRYDGTAVWLYRIKSDVTYVRLVSDWLRDVTKDIQEARMDWKHLPLMNDRSELFVACRTPRQWRFMPWTTVRARIARFNDWTAEARLFGHARGVIIDFHNREVNSLTFSKLSQSYPIPADEWADIEPV